MRDLFFILGVYAAVIFVLCCAVAFFAALWVWAAAMFDQRRKDRRGGMLEREVFARVVEEAESYTREAARQ